MPGLGEFPGRLEGNDRWPKKCSPAKPAGFPKKAHREISGSLIFRKNLIIPYATLRSMRKRMCPPIQLPALRGIFLCRLPPPPVHECGGLQSWKKKPAPGIGLRYGKGGGVTVTGGGYAPQTRDRGKRKTAPKIPWLKVMMVVIAVVVLGVAYLVLTSSAQ